MAGKRGDLASQAMLMVGGIVAANMARKVVPVVWTAATGKPAVDDPNDPDVATRDALVYSILTAVAVAVGRTLVSRRATALKARNSSPKAVAAA